MRWAISPRQQLLWDDYGSEALVFDSLSGSTHLLSASAVEALLALQQAPGGLEAAEVRAAVLDALPIPAADIDLDSIHTLLLHLDRLGLVEPADSDATR